MPHNVKINAMANIHQPLPKDLVYIGIEIGVSVTGHRPSHNSSDLVVNDLCRLLRGDQSETGDTIYLMSGSPSSSSRLESIIVAGGSKAESNTASFALRGRAS